MCAVQLLRVSVHERISAATEDVLLRVEKGEEAAEIPALRALLTERLTAAAEEIVGLFEETVAEYEDRAERSEREICRQRRLLDAVLKPRVKLHRADVQQLLVVKEEVPPEQQEWSSSLDQEDPEPPHIKEEQEDLWTSQEGEQLQGLEEADITKFTFTPVSVKSEEDDEEKPQSSQLHQRLTEQTETEADGEDCGGPEPARTSDQDTYREPNTDDKTGDSSEPEPEPETDDSDDWKETREPQSGLNSLNNDEVPVSDSRCGCGEKPFGCSECDKRFGTKTHLKEHMRIHTGEKPFSCTDCGKRFSRKGHLTQHMPVHTGEKRFSCSVCDKRFAWRYQVKMHKCVRHQSSELHQSQTEENREVAPPASSSTEQMETEAAGEDFGGPEPTRNLDPDRNPEPDKVQQLLVVKEEVSPEQQEWSSSLDQEDPEPPHIKEEQEELWTSQEGDEEKPQSSQLPQRLTKQMETEADGEDCGGPEPFRNSDPDTHPEPDTDDKTGDSSEPETEHSGVCKETREPHSGCKDYGVSVCDSKCSAGERPFSCSECGKRFGLNGTLKRHMRAHKGEKPFGCSVCKNSFARRETLQTHMRIHTGEKPFTCSVCAKRFLRKAHLKRHMMIHTGEKPFSCSVCGKSFTQAGSLRQHISIHTGDKRYSCSICDRRFPWYSSLKHHQCISRQSS